MGISLEEMEMVTSSSPIVLTGETIEGRRGAGIRSSIMSMDSVVLYLEDAIDAVRADAKRGGEMRRNPVGLEMFGREAAMSTSSNVYVCCHLWKRVFSLCYAQETKRVLDIRLSDETPGPS